MKEKLREYRADDIKVTWSQVRCIHFAACVERLPTVFDTDQKPWIQPAKAEPEEVTEAVLRCPTGALHFRRADGADEEIADTNTVQVAPDGPLYLRGDVEIHDGKGELLHDTRVALCRCGASAHGPLCDGSHKEVGFRDGGKLGNVQLGEISGRGGRLEVSPTPNGPLALRGPFELLGADGEHERGGRAALCRCGASGNKPFCDGSHSRLDFTTDDLAVGELTLAEADVR